MNKKEALGIALCLALLVLLAAGMSPEEWEKITSKEPGRTQRR